MYINYNTEKLVKIEFDMEMRQQGVLNITSKVYSFFFLYFILIFFLFFHLFANESENHETKGNNVKLSLHSMRIGFAQVGFLMR